MNKLKISLLVAILLLSSMPLLASQPAQAAPPNIIYQAPITIDNTQSSATPNPFQQMVKIPISQFSTYIYDNNVSANFEFYYANNTIIPAWIESVNSTTIVVWLKLYSIPASSSITIYIGFASKSTNLLSSSGTTGIGEAPQLSPIYGEYDDGASVFTLYSNFHDTLAGYSAHSYSGSFTPAPSTYPYDNVELLNDVGSTGAYILSPNNINLGNYILQTYWSYSGTADGFSVSLWGSSGKIYSGGGGGTPGMSGGLTYHYEFYTGGHGTPPSGNPNEASVYSLTGNGAGTLITSASASGEGTYYVYSQLAFYNTGTNSGTVAIYSSSSSSTSIANDIEPAGLYNPSYQSTANFSSISLSASPILFGAGDGGAASYVYIYWGIMRAYPPNGVMPSVSFGSISWTIFQISFYQTSLPSGTEWGIRLNNSTEVWWLNSSGEYDNFTKLFNGNYYYQVVNASGYYSISYKGEITINNANVSQIISFKSGYPISVKESGLPLGIRWWVNVSKQPGLSIGSVSVSSTNRYNNFTEPNGTYTFSISSSEPYYIEPASNDVLQFTVSGSSLSLNVYFVRNITYSGTGNRSAYANATLSYYAIKQITSSTTTISYSGSEVKNVTYSEFEISTGGPFQYNSAKTKGWGNTTWASGYYVYPNTKVWFNGTYELSTSIDNGEYISDIGVLMVNFTIGGKTYTWEHVYNYSVVKTRSVAIWPQVLFDANVTVPVGGTISEIQFYQSYYKYIWNYSENGALYTVGNATNTIDYNSSPAEKPDAISIGWSYPSVSSSFSSLIVKNITSFAIYWSAQLSTVVTYNSNSYTSSPIEGTLNVYSVTFAPKDNPTLSTATIQYDISYYLIENYTSFSSYIYYTFVYNYSILSQNSHQGQFWNSSAIYFNYTIPSDAYSSDPASYKILISNLTIPTLTANYVDFYLGYENFTYYSLTKYKNSYNITAYINVSSAKSVQFKFIMTILINNYPSASYYKVEYAGHGSTETLAVNATTPFSNETVEIADINWGDGSPETSSAIEVASSSYYNFLITHQYSTTGTFTITFLIIDAVGYSSSLSVSESTSITITLTITTTPNSAPVKTNTYIYFNYTQVNLNLQNVWLYINGILALSQNVSSNTNYLGSVAYDIPYYLTQTATFTALWEYRGGGISGSVNIEYSVANSVPTVGRWVILNYTIVVGSTKTNESIPYFYTQTIPFNATWSYYVWQIFLPQNSTDISVRGSPFWIPETISVPADFNKTTATYTLLINTNAFQVVWLAPNPVGNALIIIQYYPESAVFGEFGVNIPFNQFNTYINGKQIYSPTQQVILGQTLTINTTTVYGTLISSYQVTVQELTQFIEIPLNIVPLTIANMNSSYVIGMSVTQNGITQVGQYLMPLESVTYYVPAGTYDFTFTYLNFNTYTIVKYLNVSMTISQVAYFLITGVTLTNINAHLSAVQNNVTNLIENVNISLSNSNTNIKNELISLTLNITNTNSSISKQLINENITLSQINTKITDDVNTIIADISNFNSSVQNQFINVLTHIRNMNLTMLDQFVNVTTNIKNLNSTVVNQFTKVLTDIINLNSTVTSQFLDALTNIRNLNSTMLSQFTTVLTNIKNLNSTVVSQFTTILTNIKNMNSTISSQILNVLTNIRDINSTILREYDNITAYIVNLNSSMKSQFITLLTNIENVNSTITTQFLNVLANIKNLNLTMLKQFANISTNIKNQNSTITAQFLNVMASINNLNSTMLSQFVNVSIEIKNVNSSVASQFLNVLKNIKNLNATVMNEIRTNYYTLKFEDYAAVNSTILQVTIYSFYLNGTPTSLQLTQAIAKNLTIYYVNSDNSTTLNYTIVSVSAGVMVIQIHTNIETEMQLLSGKAVLDAKTYVIPPNSNNTALQGNAIATNFYLSGLSSYLFVLDYHLFTPIFYKINLWLIIIFLLVISLPVAMNRRIVKKNIALKHSLIALYTFLFGTMIILYLMYLHGVV